MNCSVFEWLGETLASSSGSRRPAGLYSWHLRQIGTPDSLGQTRESSKRSTSRRKAPFCTLIRETSGMAKPKVKVKWPPSTQRTVHSSHHSPVVRATDIPPTRYASTHLNSLPEGNEQNTT